MADRTLVLPEVLAVVVDSFADILVAAFLSVLPVENRRVEVAWNYTHPAGFLSAVLAVAVGKVRSCMLEAVEVCGFA